MNVYFATIAFLAVPACGLKLNFDVFDVREVESEVMFINDFQKEHSNSRRQLDEEEGEGGDQDDDSFGNEGMSPRCALSSAPIFEDGNFNFLTPMPGSVSTLDEPFYALDYSTNSSAMETYIEHCDAIGGKTLTWNITSTSQCNLPNWIELPFCIGGACDGKDAESFGSIMELSYLYALGEPELTESCSISSTVDYHNTGNDDEFNFGPDVSEVCFDDMVNIFVSGLYEMFVDTIVDEETGGYNGDSGALETFTQVCESDSIGKIIQISLDYDSDECKSVGFSSAPTCIANSCSDEESKLAFEFLVQFLLEDDECKDLSVSMEGKFGGGGTKAPKSPKGAKVPKAPKQPKATKKPKGAKQSKVSKSSKEKGTKSRRHVS